MGPRPIGRGNYGRSAPRGGGREASMGPRPIGRGNSPPMTAYLRYRRSRLQWGRDRSVAEIALSTALDGTRDKELQWGRDRSVAEIRGRGAWVRQGMAGFNGAATDRSRKLPPSPAQPPRSGMLQWGRDRSVAEMRLSSLPPQPPGGTLQWGRDRSVAEMHPRSHGAPRGEPSLQWGRDRSVAEMRALVARYASGKKASMGPRPIGRGNPSHGSLRFSRIAGRACERQGSVGGEARPGEE